MLVLAVALLGWPASPAARAEFGFSDLDVVFRATDGSEAIQAGSHPATWTTTLSLNTHLVAGEEVPDRSLRDLRIDLPPGLVGMANLIPSCARSDFLAQACPPGAEVGSIQVRTGLAETEDRSFPLYNLEARHGLAVELGFVAARVPVTLEVRVKPEPPYNLVVSFARVSQITDFFGATLTLRGTSGDQALLTLPRSCVGPPVTSFAADSWEEPGVWTAPALVESAPAPLPLDGCQRLGFHPTLEIRPTTASVQSPSGLVLSLEAPNPGLLSPLGLANADLRGAVLAFPPGMTINTSVAGGLASCTRAELAGETLDSDPGEGCPEASKLGTALVESPLVDAPVHGSLFVAQPDDETTAAGGVENPFDALIAFYIVLKDPRHGILVKQGVAIDADRETGRLTATIGGAPQLPFTRFELRLRAGPRSPLVTPRSCGAHAVAFSIAPSSGTDALSGEEAFTLDRNCAASGFEPVLSAGTENRRAGAASSLLVSLRRSDGEPNLSRISLQLPAGLAVSFAATPTCPEALAATGSCQAASRVGWAQVRAGTGESPALVPSGGGSSSQVYLAGPYRGAPFSLAIVVPARAGPFDLGTVVLRAAIFVDPRTAQATVHLDPLPRILKGVPIAYRTLRLILDRPGFVRNPTDCTSLAVRGIATSASGEVAALADRFQASDCAALPFRPRASVRLLGSSRRGGHPRVRAVLRARPRDANLRRAAITLPGTALLDSRHIRGVCPDAAAERRDCPRRARLGWVEASTPLLREPLAGPVFLRSSDGRLPGLTAQLGGDLDLDLSGRLNSVDGRLRIAFRALPDLPIERVAVTVAGGRNGLLVNAGGVCSRPHRASVSFAAQSGRRAGAFPVVLASCPRQTPVG